MKIGHIGRLMNGTKQPSSFAPSGYPTLPPVGIYNGVSAPTVASLSPRTLITNQTVFFSGSTFSPFQYSTLVFGRSSSLVADLANQTSQVPVWADAIYTTGNSVIIRADAEGGTNGGGDIDNGVGGDGGRGSCGGGGGGATGQNGPTGADASGGGGGDIFMTPGPGNPGDGFDGLLFPDTGPTGGLGGRGFGYRYVADYDWPVFADGGDGGGAIYQDGVGSAGGGGGGAGGHITLVCNLFKMNGSFFFSRAGGGGGDYFDNGSGGNTGNNGYSILWTRAYFPSGSGPTSLDELWAIHSDNSLTQIFDYTQPFDFR